MGGAWTVKNGGSWEIGPTNRWEIENPATLWMTYVRHHACALILFVILISNNKKNLQCICVRYVDI